ncbi:MAG: hypothetical protein ABSB97_06530 [Thermoplasmata archaeon]|jgi:hypothetical protein
MAKKVRRKPEEEAATAFEFPVFDDVAFVTKEFELMSALILASVIAALLGIVCWALTISGVPWPVPFGLGLFGIAFSPFVIRRLRVRSKLYTKGDWVGLIALQFFGWLALWFVLQNVSPHSL